MDFDPETTGATKYPITEYQPVYFVANSFEDAKEKMMLVYQYLICFIMLELKPFIEFKDSVTTLNILIHLNFTREC